MIRIIRNQTMIPVTGKQQLVFVVILSFIVCSCSGQSLSGRDLDRFTYGSTNTGASQTDYGPEDWSKITCPTRESCLGFSDKVLNSQGWSIGTTNHCQWCPESTGCGTHHQSPINVKRSLAIVGHEDYNICIDPHLIKYFDSSCGYDELKRKNAFTIERYGLKINQPMVPLDTSGVNAIDCTDQPGIGRRWGRADFPKGYSQWWLLSHLDFHVPSEHTQEGKRYSAEIQLVHFYSVTGEVAGVNNELGTVSIFLDAIDGAEDWVELNKVICAWREAEEKNRASCGLPSIKVAYPGCYTYKRGHSSSNTIVVNTTTTTGAATTQGTQGVRARARLLQEQKGEPVPEYIPAISALDIITENNFHAAIGNTSYKYRTIQIDDTHFENADEVDWNQFIADSYESKDTRKQFEQQYQKKHDDLVYNISEIDRHHRALMNYDYVNWFNYFPMIDVRTEYFFRYSGTQTLPPCYAKFENGNRGNTNHWRVFKDPIQVSQRQINEMHRLIKYRIAPKGDLVKSCKPDTATIPDPLDPDNKIRGVRPLQKQTAAHFAVFCECGNWKSAFKEDQEWCLKYKDNQKGRYYEQPYNFPSSGF